MILKQNIRTQKLQNVYTKGNQDFRSGRPNYIKYSDKNFDKNYFGIFEEFSEQMFSTIVCI